MVLKWSRGRVFLKFSRASQNFNKLTFITINLLILFSEQIWKRIELQEKVAQLPQGARMDQGEIKFL